MGLDFGDLKDIEKIVESNIEDQLHWIKQDVKHLIREFEEIQNIKIKANELDEEKQDINTRKNELDYFAETQIEEAIEEVIKKAIEEGFIAGCNISVLNDGKEIFYHQDGFADIENNIPIARESIFRLYSMTKPITAVAVMILLERGEIDLYAQVSDYLPGFKDSKVLVDGERQRANRGIMIKDLLSMTAGLVYPGDEGAYKEVSDLFNEMESKMFTSSAMGTVEAMDKLGKCVLVSQPGEKWNYGTCADVLGAIVEIVSGKRFGEFLKDEIFKPLGMNDTAFWVEDSKRDRLIKAYKDTANGGLEEYTGNNLCINNKMDFPPHFESGGAGLVSTIDDYSKFATMLINNGTYNGVQILRPKTVKYLTTQTLTEEQEEGNFKGWLTLAGHSYGNLMRIVTDESKLGDIGVLGEYGWDGWLGAYFTNIPSENLSIILMMQKTDAGTTTLARKLRNIIISALVE